MIGWALGLVRGCWTEVDGKRGEVFRHNWIPLGELWRSSDVFCRIRQTSLLAIFAVWQRMNTKIIVDANIIQFPAIDFHLVDPWACRCASNRYPYQFYEFNCNAMNRASQVSSIIYHNKTERQKLQQFDRMNEINSIDQVLIKLRLHSTCHRHRH